MKKIIFSAMFACMLFSCKQNKTENVERAFYYWKSNNWDFTDAEKKIIDSVQISKMYIKFFEVEKNDVMGNIPISKTFLSSYDLKDLFNIVPTVYLHNNVFLKTDKDQLDILADNVNFLLDKYVHDKLGLNSATEYQMDCDWTPSTDRKSVV